jgi:3-dehydroquinate synthetase
LDFDKDLILSGMKKDKKREGDNIHMILLESLGHAIIKNITIKNLEEMVDDLHSNF